ncbi:hypothetical protein OG218_26450 [Kineococcus sp. NBC_00420]|uniref:hypothetical protein n=1 Tax=Kineococcus sp. NBC_00420 TaxID=2903564 RepID=UPI002E24A325
MAAAVNPFSWVRAHLPGGHSSPPALASAGADGTAGNGSKMAISTAGDVKGRVVCRPSAAADAEAALDQPDGWDYAPVVTADAGLALTKLRYGPRLLADAIDVPYVRITDRQGQVHTVHLTPAPASGPNLPRVSLEGEAECRSADKAADQAIGVSATYRVIVNEHTPQELTVLIGQSYRFDPHLDTECEPTVTAQCIRFWPTVSWAIPDDDFAGINEKVAVDIVERFRLNPDEGSRIAAPASGPAYSSLDLIRDAPTVGGTDDGLHVAELGNKGQLRQAGATKILNEGVGGHWENIHQTARQGVELPGITPGVAPSKYGGGTAGCPECVHAHWTWFADDTHIAGTTARDLANSLSCGLPNCWSDGAPQILDGSKQTVCLGWDTGEAATAVDWCAAAEQTPGATTGDHAALTRPLVRSKAPVFYYDARSKALDRRDLVQRTKVDPVHFNGTDYSIGDTYWPYLPPVYLPGVTGVPPNPDTVHPHGGNGSFFFAPARKFTSVVSSVAEVTCYIPCAPGDVSIAPHRAMIDPHYPATQTPEGKWMLKVDLATGDPNDRGPYYLRVRPAVGLTLLNADPLYRPQAGGAPWVGVYDEGSSATAADLNQATSWHPVAAKEGHSKPLTAVLLFDKEPTAQDMTLQLDAAPDGVEQYQRSDGILPAPTGAANNEALADGQTHAFITSVKGQDITYDQVSWFNGADALQACLQDNMDPGDGAWCNDFYFRNTNPKLRTATVPADASITYYPDLSKEAVTIAAADLKALNEPGRDGPATLPAIGEWGTSWPWIITAKNGKVTALKQIYIS